MDLNRSLAAAAPNPSHHALADLEAFGILRALITQNVDNLHRAAGHQELIEIHGNRTLFRCIDCGLRSAREAFEEDESRLPPLCPACWGVVKGDTVMFGEPVPVDAIQRCNEAADQADCMLVVGTSATVYPASGFARAIKWYGGTLIKVNSDSTHISNICDVVLSGPSGTVFPRLVDRVRQLPEPGEPPPLP